MKPLRFIMLLLWLIAAGWPPQPARACTVPVFRYALERWEPETYLALVFHRGALTPEQEKALQQLTMTVEGPERSLNLEVQRVDLTQPQAPAVQALFQRAVSNALPSMVVVCRGRRGHGGLADPGLSEYPVVWSGPLRTEALEGMADSPARREIARRLLRGDAVVWLLAECGDAAKDNAAAQMLAAELPKLEKRLALTPPDAEMAEETAAPSTRVPLRVAFSVLRLPPRDPQEAVLGRLLRELFPASSAKPVVLPIFGRGRALVEFLPAQLNPDTLADAAAFLAGECSCLVKELNPGVDLLMAVNWDEFLDGTLSVDHALPPLTGVLPLPRSASTPGLDAATGSPTSLPAASTPGLLRRNTVLLLALVLVGICVGTVVLLRRSQRS